jgi:hypothetical protein
MDKTLHIAKEKNWNAIFFNHTVDQQPNSSCKYQNIMRRTIKMMTMKLLAFLLVISDVTTIVLSFQPATPTSTFNGRTISHLYAQQRIDDDDDDISSLITSRRQALIKTAYGIVGCVTIASTAGTVQPEVASATYTAYTRREQDWEQRMKDGKVEVKTARDLKRQLAEIAPMNNDARSKIFCPNGQSANVSPLMENKCSDQLAIPSVYGRTEDSVGNSIPGFNGGFYTSGIQSGTSSSSNLAAELVNVGYGFTTSSGQKK